MSIEIFCINDCPNCTRLCRALDLKGVQYTHYNLDESNQDFAEAGFRGILEERYPVVFIDGRKLPAMNVEGYINKIEGKI